MRIAVIGSGISGMVAARLLNRDHQVTVFESESRIGGHTNTVSAEWDGEQHQIDTGFIVFNDRNYPNFTRILNDLDVPSDPTSMSFSVRCDSSGMEYNGTNLNGVFAQRANVLRPNFLNMLRDILRFNRRGHEDVSVVSPDQTVEDYLREHRFGKMFVEKYLLPMGAAIWSCPTKEFSKFPIRFILEFYRNHGLLNLRDRPMWRVVRGGSNQYVEQLVKPFRDAIRLNCPVQSVLRTETGVEVRHATGVQEFDEVVFACHADQALKLLCDADSIETELLSAFPYSKNTAVLHTDESRLPKSRRAWASWNYRIPAVQTALPTVTYNMNILQGIRSKHTFSVTLNDDDMINPDRVLARFTYFHPVFTTQRAAIQQRHFEVIRRRRTSFCGAYWRNGFHEDGVVSALAVCRKFGIPDWIAESRQALPIKISTAEQQNLSRASLENEVGA
jgi:predicted NAD/FAD-binding protein